MQIIVVAAAAVALLSLNFLLLLLLCSSMHFWLIPFCSRSKSIGEREKGGHPASLLRFICYQSSLLLDFGLGFLALLSLGRSVLFQAVLDSSLKERETGKERGRDANQIHLVHSSSSSSACNSSGKGINGGNCSNNPSIVNTTLFSLSPLSLLSLLERSLLLVP